MEKQAYFITGIGTDVGKTVISACVVKKLGAEYWKPVQAGDLHMTDSMKVKAWVNNPGMKVHPEAYRLQHPMSPHAAAAREGVEIDIDRIIKPEHEGPLVIEGAGGILVPLNNRHMVVDLIRKFDVEVIVVSRNYLGSINHTLLTAESLKARNIRVKGVIFNGEPNPDTESIILTHTGWSVIGNIPFVDVVNEHKISQMAGLLKL